MLELGKVQELMVVKKVDFGVYLAQREGEEKVLLPARQVPHDAEIGSKIEVFLYKDSKDRLISTTARPRLTLGEVAELTVVQTGKLGAFSGLGAGEGSVFAVPGTDPAGAGRRSISCGPLCG